MFHLLLKIYLFLNVFIPKLRAFGDDWMNTLLDQFGSHLDDKWWSWEGDSIKDFNPDASIQYWFDVIARRLGSGQTMENIKHAKEAATVIEASTSQEVEDEVEMVQEMDAVEDIEYDLVEDVQRKIVITKAILTVKRRIQMTYLIR